MKETIMVSVISALTSGGVLAFIQFLITRNDDRQGIKGTLKKLEKDVLRTQLLLLLVMMPDEQKEILTLAERYFRKPPNGLGGNWYMTSLFDKWIIAHNSGAKPEWFKTE